MLCVVTYPADALRPHELPIRAGILRAQSAHRYTFPRRAWERERDTDTGHGHGHGHGKVYRSTTFRKFLLGLALIMVSAPGCGGEPEAPPPPRPAEFRQRISAPKKPPSQVTPVEPVDKAGEQVAAKPTQAKVETKPPKPLPPLPEAVPEVLAEKIGKGITDLYNAVGKLDPFQPVFVTKAVEAPQAKKKIRKKRPPPTPLQKIDLSQLRLVGIIISPIGNKALVEEPSGKGYVITRGTYVGTNFGRVKKILNDRIIVEEEVEDFFTGKMKPQTRELRLQKRPGYG